MDKDPEQDETHEDYLEHGPINYFSQGFSLDDQAIKSLERFDYKEFYGDVAMKSNQTDAAISTTVYLLLRYGNSDMLLEL